MKEIHGITLVGPVRKSLQGSLFPRLLWRETVALHSGTAADRQLFSAAARTRQGSHWEYRACSPVSTNRHSDMKYRINGPQFNVPESNDAFTEIQPDDPLYRNMSEGRSNGNLFLQETGPVPRGP